MLLYYSLAALWLLLGIALAADALVAIFPASYGIAGSLVVLVAGGFLANGALVTTYRLSAFHRRRRRYLEVVAAAVPVFLVASFALIPRLGAPGAAAAVLLTFLAATAAMLVLGHRFAKPIRLEALRLALAAGVALALWLAATGAHAAGEGARWIASALALLVFPAVLVVVGAIPRDHLRPGLRALRSIASPPQASWALALEKASAGDRGAFVLVVERRVPPAEAARRLQLDRGELDAAVVRALRAASGGHGDGELDARVGEYLLSGSSVAERDALARGLWDAGADPVEVHALEHLLEAVRRTAPTGRRERTSEPATRLR
jgi:hypothetical protein